MPRRPGLNNYNNKFIPLGILHVCAGWGWMGREACLTWSRKSRSRIAVAIERAQKSFIDIEFYNQRHIFRNSSHIFFGNSTDIKV